MMVITLCLSSRQSVDHGTVELAKAALLVFLTLPSHGLFLSWLWTQVCWEGHRAGASR
jgi:hypothetical protein